MSKSDSLSPTDWKNGNFRGDYVVLGLYRLRKTRSTIIDEYAVYGLVGFAVSTGFGL